MRLPAAALALPLLLEPAGAAAQTPQCRAPQQPQQIAELLFGRNIGDRPGVSERSFARFLEREIVPRFPDGLTVLATYHGLPGAQPVVVSFHKPDRLTGCAIGPQTEEARQVACYRPFIR